jgi:LmeA-like phospholipid-binding
VTATVSPPVSTPVRRSRRPDPRTVAFAAVVLAFIGALLAGSDYLARLGSQSLIARALQRDLHLAHRPGVHVRGVFYLPQVVSGDYHDVDIDIGQTQAGPMHVERIQASLRGVHLRFHDVLVRHVSRILIDRTTEFVTLSYADIDKYLKAIGTPVSVTSAGDQQVRFTGSVSVLGKQVSASADGRVEARGNTLYISPSRYASGIGALDSTTALLLGQRLTIELPLDKVPFAQTITGVEVRAQDIVVRAEGRNIAVDPGAAIAP